MTWMELFTAIDTGAGLLCLGILIRSRLPQRVSRIEQHLKLAPLVEDAAK